MTDEITTLDNMEVVSPHEVHAQEGIVTQEALSEEQKRQLADSGASFYILECDQRMSSQYTSEDNPAGHYFYLRISVQNTPLIMFMGWHPATDKSAGNEAQLLAYEKITKSGKAVGPMRLVYVDTKPFAFYKLLPFEQPGFQQGQLT